MAKITVQPQDGIGSEVELKQQALKIGRKDDNDIVLADRTVSRYHAELIYNGTTNCYEIHNLSITNPILLNGKSIKDKAILFDLDNVQVGAYNLHFQEK